MLGKRARADFKDHRRELSRRVVILFHRVHNALAGSKIDGSASRNGVSSRATLRSMLAFAFDGDFLCAENIQFPLRERLLVNLSAFSRWSYWIEDATISDPGFNVLRDELVAVTSDSNSRILWNAASGLAFWACLRLGHR
jgi:hypothetical protein